MNRAFMFTSYFLKEWTRLGFTDEDQIRLEEMIRNNPQIGDVISGAGGFRKARFAFEGRGKSGSARVIYLDIAEIAHVIFVDVLSCRRNHKPRSTKIDILLFQSLIPGMASLFCHIEE